MGTACHIASSKFITQTIAIAVRTNSDWSQLLSLQDFYVKNLRSKATRELDRFL